MEMIEGFVSMLGMWTTVAVVGIETVIHVSVEVVRSVEPRAGSDEDTAGEPLGTIVSVWGTSVRGVVVVAIRARRLWPDIDGDLGAWRARNAQQSDD
jgi:hypothetical protein